MKARVVTGMIVGPLLGETAKQLMILCHGIHGDASQLEYLASEWSKLLPSTAFVMPNAPLRRRGRWLGFVLPRRREWFSVHDPSPIAHEREVRRAAELLNLFIDAELDRLRLPADAYALAGFSQGAMVMLYAGFRRAVAPRALISFSGSLVGADSLEKEIKHRPPVMIIHGNDDRNVPPIASKNMERSLRLVNVPVTASFVSKLGHSIDKKAVDASRTFLMQNFPV